MHSWRHTYMYLLSSLCASTTDSTLTATLFVQQLPKPSSHLIPQKQRKKRETRKQQKLERPVLSRVLPSTFSMYFHLFPCTSSGLMQSKRAAFQWKKHLGISLSLSLSFFHFLSFSAVIHACIFHLSLSSHANRCSRCLHLSLPNPCTFMCINVPGYLACKVKEWEWKAEHCEDAII